MADDRKYRARDKQLAAPIRSKATAFIKGMHESPMIDPEITALVEEKLKQAQQFKENLLNPEDPMAEKNRMMQEKAEMDAARGRHQDVMKRLIDQERQQKIVNPREEALKQKAFEQNYQNILSGEKSNVSPAPGKLSDQDIQNLANEFKKFKK